MVTTSEIFNDPLYGAIVVVVLAVIAIVSKRFIGPSDDWVERVKRKWILRLDPILRRVWRPFTTRKYKDEYVCSVMISPDELERKVFEGGYVENDVSTVKYRVLSGSTHQYSVGQMKFSEPDSNRQWHLYIFPGHGKYGADCYQHGEEDWNPIEGGTPEDHLKSEQIPGDPESVLRDTLDEQEVSYEVDEQFKASDM